MIWTYNRFVRRGDQLVAQQTRNIRKPVSKSDDRAVEVFDSPAKL